MPPFQNTSRIRARPSLSGSRPANPLTPRANENPRNPIQPGEAQKPPDRQAGTGIGTWIMLLLACLLIFSHFGRPFEKVLIGYRIPAVLCGTAIVVLILQRNLGGFVTRIGMAMVAFMAWMVLVTPLSSWRGGSLTYVGWYLALNGVLFVILTAVAGVGYSGAKKPFYVAAFSCFFHIIIGGRFDTDRLNLQGTFGNSDDVALLAGFAIPFTVFAALQLPQFLLRILVAVPATGFLLYFIGLTATRAAIIGLACMVAVTCGAGVPCSGWLS